LVRLSCPAAALQGEVCAEIVITISGVDFTPAVENFTIPSVTKHICWYKPVGTEHADATVAISTKNICDVAADKKTSENDIGMILAALPSCAVLFGCTCYLLSVVHHC
jgi:hypothetical protein